MLQKNKRKNATRTILTTRYKNPQGSGAGRIEKLLSLFVQTHSDTFKEEDLKVLFWEWIESGHWWIPNHKELIEFAFS